MSKRPFLLLSAAMMLLSPSLAQADEVEAWTPTATALRASSAGITMPQTVAGLSLSKSGEVTNGGKGIDNYAQYLSDDGAIQATLYIYMPSYADASIAAYMTDKAIMERFGAKTRRTAYADAAVAGRPNSAIRAVYDDAADGALTTAAAFVHAGRWLVKLRVTGPTEQRKAVIAGLDGMLAAIRFDDPAALHRVAPARVATCAAGTSADARVIAQTPAATADAGIARDGRDALCISGQVDTAQGRYDILRQANVADGATIVPVDDAGTVLAFDPAKAGAGTGYQFSIHSVGQTDLYGVYDRVPTPRQIAAILDGKDPQTAQAKSVADHAANGEIKVRTSAR